MSSADTTSLQQAVHTLYSDHHGWLQSWLGKKLGCTYQAADLAHDTFVRLLHKTELNFLIEPRAFLTAIARGVLIDHWRREDLQRAWLEVTAHESHTHSPSVESQQLMLGLLQEISYMLEGLKPKVRTAFLLAQLEGMSHRQISSQMGVSLRTVERYVAEALYHCYLLRYSE